MGNGYLQHCYKGACFVNTVCFGFDEQHYIEQKYFEYLQQQMFIVKTIKIIFDDRFDLYDHLPDDKTEDKKLRDSINTKFGKVHFFVLSGLYRM